MPTADLVFKNANIITIDSRKPKAEFVAIKGDRIFFVGLKDQVGDFIGPDTKVIDCTGKTLLPGFNDAHCHVFSFIRKLTSIDLSPPKVKSISDIMALIKEKVDNTPPGQWISGTDYSDFHLAEKRHPTRWEIDEVAPNNPVVLSHRSLHACVLNSRALALAHITTETPEPPGAMIGRDVTRNGEPNGLLIEMLGYIREQVMPPISDNALDEGIKLSNQQYISQGLTSLQDATVVNDLKRWHHYRRFKERGFLKSRVYMMIGAGRIMEFHEAGLSFGAGDENLRLGAVKIVPSLISEKLHPSLEELQAVVLGAHRAGFQVAIHGVQVELIDAIVRTYEYVQKQAPDFEARRHRIEHCAECPPPLMERIKRLKLVIATHPAFAYFSGDRYLATVSREMLPWLYRIGTMLRNGLVVAGASDSPVVSNNPLMGIYGGLTRVTDSGDEMSHEERVSINQAITLYTLNGAYASHEDAIKGSITPGKLADLVLLSDDINSMPIEAIKDIKVRMTVIGGKIVWEI